MILRAFLAIGTFLLILAVVTETPLISKKEVASRKKQQQSRIQKRQMELGTFNLDGTDRSKPSIIMNDPAMHKKWGLQKSNALDAWQLTTGSREIVVAIVDTGIDVNHPDLKNNLWRNPGETGKDALGRDKATNGVDDDKNGYIDDVHGWNFVTGNNHIKDNHGHGTHIAGIVGAEGGNKYGVTGVAPKVSLMVLKYFDPNSTSDNLVNTIKAFNYAVKMNAHIINYSGGGNSFSRPEYLAVKRAEQKGILFVAAAGNERSNSDFNKYYPADYDLDNIVSVTAINPNLRVLSSSNYGTNTVDIAAPGENIYSTFPTHLGGAFRNMTGTSQATAFVSGVAALLMAHNRDFDAKAIRKYILKTGDRLQWLKSKTSTSRKLNVYRALSMLDQGVGVSGVVAQNTTNPDSDIFEAKSSDSNRNSSLSRFGQSLLRAIEKKK
ncbi:MAG: S8 family peptidase [Pseudomonadota bacterium]